MLVIKVTHSAQSFDFGLAVTIQPYLFPSQTCAQDAFGGFHMPSIKSGRASLFLHF
jgi:hypothetical protein